MKMHEQAYLAALELAKGAIDREEIPQMKYWLGICSDYRKYSEARLTDDYKGRAIGLLVKDCR